jgi:uncharacterized protein YbcI
MRKSLITTFFSLISIISWSQSAAEIKANPNKFLYGEGNGASIEQADKQALSELISQISVNVESRFSMDVLAVDNSGNKAESFKKEKVQSVVNTYSNATLTNTERLILSDEPEAKVLRYIRKEDVQKIFDQRKNRILDFANEADRYISQAKVADALKYYYWALILLKSHPDANYLTIQKEGQPSPLINWLPARINDVFDNLNIRISGWQKEATYQVANLGITYKNIPVENFDYTWFDGRDWGTVTSAKDGIGFIEMPAQSNFTSVKMKAEYMFTGEARADKELEQVMSATIPVPFRKAHFEVTTVVETSAMESISPVAVTSMNSVKDLVVDDVSQYKPIVKLVSDAILNQQPETVKQYFTVEGYAMLTQLSSYGKAVPMPISDLKALSANGKTIVRPLKMGFSFSNNKKFVEDLVFAFNEQNKIESLAFGLNQTALDDILNNDAWPPEERLTIITFLEHYKTAYALKRIDYIESIFSDKALIIVGSVLKMNPTAENKFQSQIITYNKLSKADYIKHLQASFRSKEYINIEFEDNEVRRGISKGGKGNLYGIQIKQNYFSSNYGDSGYLYLQVEFPDPDTPVIYVRTWQPEKQPDGSIYGMENF